MTLPKHRLMLRQMSKAKRYTLTVVGFAVGAFMAPFLLGLFFVAVAAIATQAHL